MNKQELHEAFSAVRASDALKKQVISVEMENKKTVNGRVLARRAVVYTTLAVLMIGFMVFGTGTHEKMPFISVIVYADDTDGVELQLPHKNSAVSNITEDGYFSSNPVEGNDEVGRFSFRIHLNEYEKQYAYKKVYQDGKELTRLNTKELLVADATVISAANSDDQVMRRTETVVVGYTDTQTQIEIHYLKENGDLLLKCVISITPQEEGFLVVLEEVYVNKED